MGYSEEDYAILQQQQYEQQLANQMRNQQSSIPLSKDNDFMQWLFNFKEEVISPLIHIWRGEEEISPGNWIKPKNHADRLVIMNEKGITWCSSYIASYINAVYIVSNYDENAMNWTMRKVGRIVWNSLSKRFEEFELRKIDIPRVCNEIISKVHAVLLGARGDGYRRFFQSTHQISEIKRNDVQNNQSSFGWGLFKRSKNNVAEAY